MLTARGKRGIYHYDFQYDGRRYKGSTKTGDLRRAQRALAIVRASVYRGTYDREFRILRRGRLTLEQFVQTVYLPEVRTALAPSTYPGLKYAMARLCRLWGAVPMSQVTPTHIEAYKAQRGALVSPAMVSWDLRRIRRLFTVALAHGQCRDNPARAVKLPRVPQRTYRLLEPHEEAAFFAAFVSTTARELWQVAFLAGLRRGEVVGLLAGHVNLERRTLTVTQPKTGHQKIVPLVDEAYRILHPRVVGRDPKQPVFRTSRGGPFSPLTAWWHFNEARKRVGIKGLRPHDLRHTLGTGMARKGERPATIGSMLGHRPPYRTTLIYTQHLAADELREAMVRFRQSPQESPQTDSTANSDKHLPAN